MPSATHCTDPMLRPWRLKLIRPHLGQAPNIAVDPDEQTYQKAKFSALAIFVRRITPASGSRYFGNRKRALSDSGNLSTGQRFWNHREPAGA